MFAIVNPAPLCSPQGQSVKAVETSNQNYACYQIFNDCPWEEPSMTYLGKIMKRVVHLDAKLAPALEIGVCRF
jgi:hypothetical protein